MPAKAFITCPMTSSAITGAEAKADFKKCHELDVFNVSLRCNFNRPGAPASARKKVNGGQRKHYSRVPSDLRYL